MKIHRQHMPEQPAAERAHNFVEVNLGLDTAVPPRRPCAVCPARASTVSPPVRRREVRDSSTWSSPAITWCRGEDSRDNVLPAVTDASVAGEAVRRACILGNRRARRHRYLESYHRRIRASRGKVGLPKRAPRREEVAIMAAARRLELRGDLALPATGYGARSASRDRGVLVYASRNSASQAIVREEVDNLRQMGRVQTNVVVGRTVTWTSCSRAGTTPSSSQPALAYRCSWGFGRTPLGVYSANESSPGQPQESRRQSPDVAARFTTCPDGAGGRSAAEHAWIASRHRPGLAPDGADHLPPV